MNSLPDSHKNEFTIVLLEVPVNQQLKRKT